MMGIISMEMDEMYSVMWRTQSLQNGSVQVEMKWLLITVMNGVEMDSDMKIHGFGIQGEISTDFRKSLVMKEI